MIDQLGLDEHWRRSCAFCVLEYDRTARVLLPLRKQCERAWGIDFYRVRRILDGTEPDELDGLDFS